MVKHILIAHLAFVALAVLIAVVGLLLPRRKESSRTVEMQAVPEEVWNIVTDHQHHARWRTDLKDLELIEQTPKGEVWMEHPKSGSSTTFKTRKRKPFVRYEAETVNAGAFRSSWVGVLEELDNGNTRVTVTEYAEIGNPFMRVLAHLYFDQGTRIDRYLKDLNIELTRYLERMTSQTS